MSYARAASEKLSSSPSSKTGAKKNDDNMSISSSTREQGLLRVAGPVVGLGTNRDTHTAHGIQPKLTINEPGDKYEKEADRVADAVMRMPEPETTVDTWEEVPSARIQRLCPRCQRRYRQGKPLNCEECEGELQRKESRGESLASDGRIRQQIQSIRGGGKPLSPSTRSFFEPRFSVDFSDVRVHTGRQAAQSASDLAARAYTVDRHIVFNSGQYRPDTDRGKSLLAHELTHIVQQGGGIAQRRRGKNQSGISLSTANMVQRDGPVCEAPAATYDEEEGVCYPDMTTSAGRMCKAPEREGTYDRKRGTCLLPESETAAPPLSDSERNALFTRLVKRISDASDDFIDACSEVEEDLKAEAEAQAALAGVVIDAATAFVVPGLGKAITKLADTIPVSSSERVYKAALTAIDRADSIAGAIGEVGKNATNAAVKAALSSKPRDFCNALKEGFQTRTEKITAYVAKNIENRKVLPDKELWLYVANWDPAEITSTLYAREIRKLWEKWHRQVLTIGQGGMVGAFGGTISRQVRAFWVEFDGENKLALLSKAERRSGMRGRVTQEEYVFLTWIAPKFQAAAIAKTKQVHPKGVETVSKKDVERLPNDAD